MSFFPCYLLFNEHEFKTDETSRDDVCFPFNISGIWEPATQSTTLFKQRAGPGIPCLPALHVESSQFSVPCCISSLECMEPKESKPDPCESKLPVHCLNLSPMDIPNPH
jgi:hypothetical protein